MLMDMWNKLNPGWKLAAIGCVLILMPVMAVNPIAALIVAGAMCIVGGIVWGVLNSDW